MALKSFSYFVAAVSLVALIGCQSRPPKPQGPQVPRLPSPGRPQPPPPVVDQTEEDFPTPPSPEPPSLQTKAPKKVAVILGPGGAKTYAHVGVLKALQQSRIPVEKVVGLEWGALMGGLFALKGQTHDLEWKLYKLEQSNLPYPKGFFSRGPGEESAKVMDNYLKDAFAKADISAAKIPFSCPSQSMWTGTIAWQNRGSISEAVRRCLPFPPVFKAQGTFIAGASQVTGAIESLIKEGYNVIIFVNVLGSAMPFAQDKLMDNLNHVILWQEVRRELSEAGRYNIDIVDVNTSAFPIVGFDDKKELVVLGEKVGASAASALITKYRF